MTTTSLTSTALSTLHWTGGFMLFILSTVLATAMVFLSIVLNLVAAGIEIDSKDETGVWMVLAMTGACFGHGILTAIMNETIPYPDCLAHVLVSFAIAIAAVTIAGWSIFWTVRVCVASLPVRPSASAEKERSKEESKAVKKSEEDTVFVDHPQTEKKQ